MPMSSLGPPGAGRQGWMPRAAADAAVAATLGNPATEGDIAPQQALKCGPVAKPKTPVSC